MAIGSAPEVGVKFTTWGKMDQASRDAWHEYIRVNWSVNIMAGFARIIPKPDIQAFNQKEGYDGTIHPHGGE